MTPRQEEYLLIFAAYSGRSQCIAGASAEFGVSKATASHLSSQLEEKGLIRKDAYGVVELTQLGWEKICGKLARMKELEQWLEVEIKLPPALAEREARRMVTTLDQETTEAILEQWRCCDQTITELPIHPHLSALAEGIYSVPFQLYKPGSDQLSMGDKGFHKPAILIRSKEDCRLQLRPVHLRYASNMRTHLSGTLMRLWYCSQGSWHETAHEDGIWTIPGQALCCSCEAEGWTAMVRVRARATVSQLRMPESEADLIINLEQIKLQESAAAELQHEGEILQ